MSGCGETKFFDIERIATDGRLRRLWALMEGRRTALGSIATLALKIGGAGLMMGIFLIAARSMPPEEFGRLAVSFNALSFLAVLGVFGQDILVVRCWGEYTGSGAHGLAQGVYKFGWSIVASAALSFAALTLIVGILDPQHRFSVTQIATGAVFLAMQLLLLFTAQTTRVIINFVVSETNREIIWRMVLLPVVVTGLWVGLTPAAFYAAAAAGLALAVILQLLAINRHFPSLIRSAKSEMLWREWLRRSGSMWVSAILEAASQYAEVLILGLLTSPDVAGLYFVAARMANIFAMLSSGLHSYTVAHVSKLYHAGRIKDLQKLLRSVMFVALMITLPLIVFIVFFGNILLQLYGRHYVDSYWVLISLSIGTFVISIAGPSNGLLLVTGHEKMYSRVLLGALLLRVGFVVWAAPRFGAEGVAVAWTVVNGPMAIGLAITTRRLTGIDPSMLSLVRGPAFTGNSS